MSSKGCWGLSCWHGIIIQVWKYEWCQLEWYVMNEKLTMQKWTWVIWMVRVVGLAGLLQQCGLPTPHAALSGGGSILTIPAYISKGLKLNLMRVECHDSNQTVDIIYHLPPKMDWIGHCTLAPVCSYAPINAHLLGARMFFITIEKSVIHVHLHLFTYPIQSSCQIETQPPFKSFSSWKHWFLWWEPWDYLSHSFWHTYITQDHSQDSPGTNIYMIPVQYIM